MRVLHVPDVRDANPYQHRLAEALQARGVTVDHASSHAFPLTHVLPPSRRPEILHLHWAHPFLLADNPLLARSKARLVPRVLGSLRRLGVGLVWTVHNLSEHAARHPQVELEARRRLARTVNALLTHCPAARDAVVDTYNVDPAKVHVAPHGPLEVAPGAAVDGEAARDALDLDPGARVLLHAGKLRAYKGVTDLLEAFRDVEGDAMVLVAGEPASPQLRERLTTMAAEDARVRLDLRFLPQADLTRALAAADVLALPYRRILTSGTVHLGLHHGVPILAPRLGCIPHAVGSADDLLYDPEDPGGLREALREAVTRDLDPLREATRARARALPTWADAAEAVHTVYERIT